MRHNQAQGQRAKSALEKAFVNLRDRTLPQALDEIGKSAVAYTQATKTYQNRTGNLVKKHDYVVIPAGQTRTVTFEGKDDAKEEVAYQSGPNEVLLVLYAKPFYAFFVEIKHGFQVIIQGFLKIRREGVAAIADKLKSRKLF